MSTPRAALEQAVRNVGSIARLAKLLDVSRQAVHRWINVASVPPKRCPDIERVSGVPCEQLRPDIYRRRGGKGRSVSRAVA